jgi:hypothetical protein
MSLRQPIRIVLSGLGLGLAFDLLFNGKLPGISVPLFALLLLSGVALTLRGEGVRALRANLWLPVALLFFAGMAFVRANGFITFLNISTSLYLVALLAVHLTRQAVGGLGLGQQVIAPLQAVAFSLLRSGDAARLALRQAQGDRPPMRWRQALPFLRGLLLAAPVVLILTALLASADTLFADLIDRVLRVELPDLLIRAAGHAALSAVIAALAAGGLAYAVWRQPDDPDAPVQHVVSDPARFRFLGHIEALVLINAVNLLFLAFVVVQIPYLFGGYLNIASDGFTYAQYARRGFGELVAVAVLTVGLIVLLNAITRRAGERQSLAFTVSSTLLLALTAVMLISAFKRLWLYELAYGFTEMRLYPHVFMVWLGLLLAWFVFALWLRPNRFAVGMLIAALGFVGTLDVLNVDDLIVRLNYQHYQRLQSSPLNDRSYYGEQIDVTYLSTLSDDAIPALVGLAEALEAYPPAQRALDEQLRAFYARRNEQTGWRRWPAWHLARARAYRLLHERYGVGVGERLDEKIALTP